MIAVQVHHAIGKLPGSALSDYAWETLTLGGQAETFASQDDTSIPPLVAKLLTRPDIIGVRLVYQPDSAVAAASDATGIPLKNAPGDVLATFGQ